MLLIVTMIVFVAVRAATSNLHALKALKPLGRLHEKHILPGLSPCEIELGRKGNGRYLQLIAREFSGGLIQPEGSPPNMQCKCVSSHWMTCFIIVRHGSLEEKIVADRLMRHATNFAPFTLIPSNTDKPKLVFKKDDFFSPPTGNSVIAELQFINPEECIMEMRCVSLDGEFPPICPFTMQPISSGDAVFIFDREFQAAITHQDIHVHCISAIGMRRILSDDRTIRQKGFEDPFKIFKKRLMTRKDYAGPFMIANYDNADNCKVRGTPLPEPSEASDSEDSDFGLIFETNDESGPRRLNQADVEISTKHMQRGHFVYLLIFIILIFTLLSTSCSSKHVKRHQLSIVFLSQTPS